MPTRLIRESDIISNQALARLSWATECFVSRLRLVVDDYGRHVADPALLRAAMYPYALSKVSEPDVSSRLAECENAGLVRTYETGGRRYVEVLHFDQRKRFASKCPPPPGVTDPPPERGALLGAVHSRDRPKARPRDGPEDGGRRRRRSTRAGGYAAAPPAATAAAGSPKTPDQDEINRRVDQHRAQTRAYMAKNGVKL